MRVIKNVLQRTLGMRFLLPVYFIPLVEVTTHSTTSPATTDKGTVPVNEKYFASIHYTW